MRVLFAGAPDIAVPSLHALLSAGHDVVAVVSKPDAPAGRGRSIETSAVTVAAREAGIPVLQPPHAASPAFVTAVQDLAVEVAVVVAWGAFVPDQLLVVPRHGWINAHFSLLPAYRGAAPVQRALIAGETSSGVTTFRLVSGMDAGPVYRQKIIDIAVDEVAGELLTRLSHVAAQELVSTLTDITNGLQPVPQSDVGVTFAPKLKVEEVRLNLREPAERIRGLIRGANPNPGAWCEFRNSRLKVLRTEQQSIDCYQAALALVMPVADLKRLMAPGVLFPSKRTLLVCCGDARFLALSELQANGKRPLPGAEWARGARVQPGERLA